LICTEVRIVVVPLNDQQSFRVAAGDEHPDIPFEIAQAMPTQVTSPVSLKPEHAMMLIMQRHVPMSESPDADEGSA
jgi:hypothetical protein